ncbi:MAG TPA: hypothetical protein VIK06_08875 [Candidatus Limnocylindrales bacterium]
MNEPDGFGDDLSFGGPLVPRGRRLPPILSVALVAGAIALIAGLGFGYRLGQESVAPASAAPAPSAPAPTASPAPIDLQADSVSARLQRAYGAAAPASWAVCGLDAAISCYALNPGLSVSPAVSHTDSFTDIDWIRLGPPPIQPGHLALAASLGQGSVAGSLVRLNDPTSKARSRPPVKSARCYAWLRTAR